MAGSNLHTFTDTNFNLEVLGAKGLVLVDFWAEWCGPCRALAPIVEQLSGDYSGRVKVGKLDVDENQATMTKYQVRGIPTLILFKDGQVAEQIVGFRPKAEFTRVLDKHLVGA